MLKDPSLDIVCIATPPFLHRKIALDVIAAGKNFIVEKPMATTVPDAEKIIKAAKKSGICGSVNHMLRFHPLWQAVRQIFKEKIFGNLQKIELENLSKEPLTLVLAGDWRELPEKEIAPTGYRYTVGPEELTILNLSQGKHSLIVSK